MREERKIRSREMAKIGEQRKLADMATKPLIWDCGSSLYDSFELKSFERQLDSAIHSRTLSMPHLSDRRIDDLISSPPHPSSSSSSQPQQQSMSSKKSSSNKISRSFQKFLRSVFKPKQNQNQNPLFHHVQDQYQSRDGSFYAVAYDKSAALSTIPEVPEFDGSLSSDIRSLVRRTASDRFTATSIGISCA
ncbi:hypothetical protein M9H77_32543 [Catharanthus roseus]|uniref:Uncharacterized protein n=1 Tax=Catharanthus roseus TaxID=4058 RepID=A0ACC0A458_CATRO|nr:hypothetical protein M9H77_32543 [Catharanthus roseus]